MARQDWAKIIGPFFMYANDMPTHEAQHEDAKLQYLAEKAAWPYSWVTHPLYQTQNRSEVTGRLQVQDTLKPKLTGADAWVGLCLRANASQTAGGIWQNQGLSSHPRDF